MSSIFGGKRRGSAGHQATEAVEAPDAARGRRFAREGEGANVTAAADADVERQLDLLVEAFSGRGEMSRGELRSLTDAKRWGPGRFGRVLELGVLSGRIRRTGRDRYAAGGNA